MEVYLAINRPTEEELVVGRVEIQRCHKVCVSALVKPIVSM